MMTNNLYINQTMNMLQFIPLNLFNPITIFFLAHLFFVFMCVITYFYNIAIKDMFKYKTSMFMQEVLNYLNNFNIKYLVNLLKKNILFRLIVIFVFEFFIFTDLLSCQTINWLVSGYIAIKILSLFKTNSTNNSSTYIFVSIVFNIIIISVFWYLISVFLPLVFWSTGFIGNELQYYILLMSDEEPSQVDPSSNHGSPQEEGGEPEGGEPEGGEPEQEQVDFAARHLQRIGDCNHDNLGVFVASSQDDVENTPCDMSTYTDNRGQPASHLAFDHVGDEALLCNDCHAVICKGCHVDYTDEGVPESDFHEGEPTNGINGH